MKILLMTIGSRGDVEPFIALGKALIKKGHEVELCTAQRFKAMVTEHGLSHQPITDQLFDLIEGDTFESMGNLFSGVKTAIRLMKASKPIHKQMIIDCIKAGLTVKPNLIVFHPKCLAAVSIAESLRIPAVMAALQLMTVKTSDFPPAGMPNLGRRFNRWSYKLVSLGFKQFSKELNRQRQAKLDLPRLTRSDGVTTYRDGKVVDVIHAFSEAIIPRPSDWPESAFISGYWQLELDSAGYQPSQKLAEFLADGAPPIYIGFGSMTGKDPKQTTQIVIDAVTKAKVRAIIATGWGGLEAADLPDNILPDSILPDSIVGIEGAPHDWLFDRVAAVVHHGGAGTTAAGLKAGKPTLICPFFGDQPFLGSADRKARLGPGTN